MKTNCPQVVARPVQAPAPATLRITVGGQGRDEPSRTKERAFQLTAEEAKTAPDVVAGMFLPLILLFMNIF